MSSSRSTNPLRAALLAINGVLLLNVAALGGYKLWKGRQPSPERPVPVAAAPKPESGQARAQAVQAIAEGHYDQAIELLSARLKAGQGVSDEAELLRVAKDLQLRKQASAPPLAPAPAIAAAPPQEPKAAPARADRKKKAGRRN